MYARFFGLKREPFSIAPDPRYLYMSDRHREALAHLLYGVKGGGGFVLLTGEIGAGKTTVCRCFLEQIPPRCNVAYIFNPKLTVEELLRTVCDEFRIPVKHDGSPAATVKDYVDSLNEFLLKTHAVGQNNVLIIDEAQNLSPDVLEQLRLLTNLETNERKLLQIILIGQPELRTMLAQPELEQLAQRVIARFHLEALTPAETTQYIRHRLAVAGMTRALPFDTQAMSRIHELSRGVPRRINLLCDRALLGAYGNSRPSVDRAMVDKAAQEVFGVAADGVRQRWTPQRVAIAGGGALACIALLGLGTVAMDSRHSAATSVASSSKPASGAASAARASSGTAATATVAMASASPPATRAPAAASAPPAPLATGIQSAIRSEREAWRALAPAWDLKLADNGDPCQAAEREQVQCFKSTTSNLALIRQLARPGIVSVRDATDKTGYALLTGLGDQTATLRTGDVTQTVSLATLATVWKGDFATFFRVPPGYVNKVVDSDSGPMAEWLSAQLARVDSGSASGGPLKPRVFAFQLAQGLKADGLAGPTTFMQLNRAMGIPEPRLQNER